MILVAYLYRFVMENETDNVMEILQDKTGLCPRVERHYTTGVVWSGVRSYHVP